MRALAAIGRELVGLFVDDGRFALAIALWVAVMAGLARFAPVEPAYQGPLLFIGLAGLLVWTCLRATAIYAAKRSSRK